MLRLLTLVAITIVAAMSSVALARSVGGPPTNDYERCFHEVRPCGEPVVIGEAKNFTGRIEHVGFSSSVGPCLSFEPISGFFAATTCGVETHPAHDDVFGISHFATERHDLGYSILTGTLREDVSSVVLHYRRHGRSHSTPGDVSEIGPDLAEQIGADGPFKLYVVAARGCVPLHRLELLALDENRGLVERKRFHLNAHAPCGSLTSFFDSGERRVLHSP